jgi:hypothetical protein
MEVQEFKRTPVESFENLRLPDADRAATIVVESIHAANIAAAGFVVRTKPGPVAIDTGGRDPNMAVRNP